MSDHPNSDDNLPDRVMEAIRLGEFESHPDGTMTVCGLRFDRYGNPMVKTTGCPNCGKGAGWVDILEDCAAANAGRDMNGPCSRRCALQIEFAASIAGDQILREAGAS